MLEFNEALHEYKLDGVILPSVTTVIAPLYDFSTVSEDVMKRAGAFGSAVHLACELHDLGELDESTLDPAIVPYLEGWKEFLRLSGARIILNEARYAGVLGFAGTIDRLVEIGGKRILVDIKTSTTLSPAIGVQLAAYRQLLLDNRAAPSVESTAAVQLKGNGDYKYQLYSSKLDWPTFVSCLTIHNWRLKNGK